MNQDIVFDGYRIVIDAVAGVSQIITPNFLVYPNPAVDAVTLIGMNGVEVQSINVVNTSGAIVRSITDVNNTDVTIDVNNMEEGIYFIHVETASSKEVIRFVKK